LHFTTLPLNICSFSQNMTMLNKVIDFFSEILFVMRNESIIFVIAVLVHAVLFYGHRVGGGGGINKKHRVAQNKPGNKSFPTTPKKKNVEVGVTEMHDARNMGEGNPPGQQEWGAQIEKISSLKALQRGVSRAEADQKLLPALNETELDEALLTAGVDAAIRIDRTDLLPAWVRRQQGNFHKVKRAHTFNSIIRAYGAIHDVKGVWNTWQEMQQSNVAPNCVTLGCMVEALVANGDPDAAYDLIHDIRSSQGNVCKAMVNAVIYGTVLKGFAHQKKFSRVWSVYQEMLAIDTDFTIVTFNTIIDACARCKEQHRIPTVLEDMDRLMIQPNIITYGAVLKGYCQEGNLDKAYELLRSMRETTDFKPDEIMYNSLLDGCSRQGLWDRALSVLREMNEAGIRPSNYTLSVLVKVGHRSTAKLDDIFSVCQAISQKNGFRFNVHVFANLVHVCVDRRDWRRAFEVFCDMLGERVRPDARAYTVLLKGLQQAGDRKAADGLLRAALGLPGAHPKLMKAVDNNKNRLRPDSPLLSGIVSELVDGIVGSCAASEHELGASLLRDVKSLGFSVDARVKLRFAARVTKS